MGIVAGALQTAGQCAGRYPTADIAHTTTKTYGIGCDNSVGTTQIAKHDAVVLVFASLEFKSAQIDPSRTTHLLVDTEFCWDALMPDGVVSIINAAFDRLVADIDCIAARFWDIWQIGSQTLVALIADCLDFLGRTRQKWIFLIDIRPRMEGESQ